MIRFRTVSQRYGWQTPFVVFAILAKRSFVRGTLYGLWIRIVTLGTKGASIQFGHDLLITPGAYVEIGNGVTLGDRTVLEVMINPKAILKIGDGTWLSHDCHINCTASVDIGAHVLVGEFVSIRDGMHEYSDRNVLTKCQGDRTGSISIRNDVWIGRGCLIQGRPEGIELGRGCVIAANSVVACSIPEYEVWGGSPARFIKHRGERAHDASPSV